MKYGLRGWLSCLRETGKKQPPAQQKSEAPFLIQFTSLLTCRLFFPCVSEQLFIDSLPPAEGEKKTPIIQEGTTSFFPLSLDKGKVLRACVCSAASSHVKPACSLLPVFLFIRRTDPQLLKIVITSLWALGNLHQLKICLGEFCPEGEGTILCMAF